MRYIHSSLLMTTLLLIGCSTLVTDFNLETDKTLASAGVLYYLPMRLHKVVITISKTPKGDAKEIDKALTLLIKASGEKETSAKTLSDAKELLKKAEEEDKAQPSVPALIEAVSKAKASVAVATKANEAAQKEYIKAVAAYDDLKSPKLDSNNNPICKIALDITAQELVPDPAQPHIAALNHLPWREDTLKITTTPAGLLSGAEGSSTDKTADILIELAKAVALFGGKVPLQTRDIKFSKEPTVCTEGTITNTVNFADGKDVKALNSTLKSYVPNDTPTIKVAGFFVDQTLFNEVMDYYEFSSPPDRKDDASECPYGANKSFVEKKKESLEKGKESLEKGKESLEKRKIVCHGLYYRRDLPYVIKLQQQGTVLFSTLISMPQASPIAVVPFDTGGFTKTTYNVTFDKGMLQVRDVTRPSELLALVKLPVDMARGVMQILTDFISLRIDYSSKDKALANAEKERLAAIKSLQDAIKAQTGIQQ